MSNIVNVFNNDVEELVNNNINLVHYFAKKIKLEASGVYDYEDVFQIGAIGLFKAAQTYNGQVKFSTYASKCINNEIYMFFRNKRKSVSTSSLNEVIYRNDEDEVRLLDIISDNYDISACIEEASQLELIYNILLNNFSYDRILLILKVSASKKQTDIAKEYNISQSYVSRLFFKLITELRSDMNVNKVRKRVFRIKKDIDQSQIAFYSHDSHKIKNLITKLKRKFDHIEGVDITYFGSEVNISVPYNNMLIDIIIMVIQNIYDNSIEIYEKD